MSTRFIFAVLVLFSIIVLSLLHRLDAGGAATTLVALISAFFGAKMVEYARKNGG